jgi:hypothetical protein
VNLDTEPWTSFVSVKNSLVCELRSPCAQPQQHYHHVSTRILHADVVLDSRVSSGPPNPHHLMAHESAPGGDNFKEPLCWSLGWSPRASAAARKWF